MARVLSYERVVDAVLIHTNPALDTEIQNETKIKEEPVDTTSNTDTTEDYTLVRNCFSLIDHDYHHYRDELSLSENNISGKNINNKENRQLSNSHSTYSNDVNKTVNLERISAKTKKEQIRNTSSQLKKKRKYSNEASNNKNTIALRTTTTENVRGKRKQQSITECKTKTQHTTGSARKKCTKCDICFREFSSVRNCEAHKQYYEFVGDYNCRICKKHYVTREKLHSHMCHRIHNARTSSYNYNCNFCSRAFKSKAFLQSHLFHIHSELIYSSNTIKHKNRRSENVNTSPGDHTLRTGAHEEPLCLNNLIKSEDVNTTPTKRLRQPTLTEYLELCKKKRDIKLNPNKLNIMKDDFSTCASHHDGEIKGNSKPKLSEEYIGRIDSLSMKLDNLPEQTAYSTLEENIKHETCLSKKPFVKLHADVEMMKSFLEKLSDTVVKDKVTEDKTSNIVSYDREIPYSLRSLRVISSVETGSNSGMRKSKNISKESRFNIEFSTRREQNVIDSDKVDSKINWKSIMTRFKCKECTISLIKCDEQPRNFYQSSSIGAIKNTPLITQCNFTLLQESDIRDKLILKDLEVSLERLTAVPIVDIKAKTKLDVEKRSCFLCKVCKKSFSSKLAIRIHFKSSHIAYMSSICDARYTLKHKLFRHYLREHSFKQNQCCICYMSLPDYEALKQHLNVHCLKYIQREDDQYPIDIELKCNLTKKSYKCLHCNKTFSLQSSLLTHQSYCTVQEEMEHQQDFMKNTSASSKNIIKVQHNKNTDENIVTCDERIHSDNLCEPSNSDFVKKSNEHRILLVSEEEPKVNEDVQNFNNDLLIEKKIETINESQDSKKLSENNNSSISNQNIANAQLGDITIRTMTYPCAICGKQFHNPKNLEVHIRTFSFTTDICPMCGTGFSSKRLLQTHIAAAHVPQISKTYSFHCVFCNQGFFKKHDLRPHILHLHGQQVLNTLTRNPNMSQATSNESVTHTATCNVCNLVFETHDRYVEHRMYYYKNHTFTCSLCAQNFQGMYMFHHHNKLTHYSEDKRKSYSYICDICNEGFNHESHFYSHNMHVHSNEVNLVETTKESEERSCFNHASDVQKQIRNCSTDKQAEQPSNECICQICQLKCIDMNDMARHRELYSNDGDFKCDKCNRQCRTFYLLDQHRKLTHFCRDIYNGHICHICGEVLETIIALKCHEKHFHSNITSSNADNLKNYGQTSSNITCKAMEHPCESTNNTCNIAKYNCLFCDMKFSTANTVQTHIVHVHMDDMIAKRATLKLTLPIIDSNDIQKQFVETIHQAPSLLSSSSSSSLSSLSSSSEASPTQLLQRSITQRSNNMLSNIMAKNGINDKTTIELLRKFRAIHPKNNKITETTSIPAITYINRSEDNISTFGTVTSSMESKADTSVSLSTGSTVSRIVASNVEFKTNTSVLLSTGSTIFKTSSTVSKDNTSVLLSTGSTNEFKDNSTSSSSRSIIIDKCKIAPVCPLPTGSLKDVVLQSWKSNDVTNQRSESVNSYSHGYSCPLCSLEYPSLMFFHAHLKYAHADSIRTNELIIPQMNQARKTSMIECLLCPCIFIDETKYKKHLRNSHTYYVYIQNSEEIAKINNVSNSLTQTNVGRSTIPETITVDDDDNDNYNVENTSDQRPEVIATLDHKRQNEKIGKLRVKPFAKIIENLSTDSALKLL